MPWDSTRGTQCRILIQSPRNWDAYDYLISGIWLASIGQMNFRSFLPILIAIFWEIILELVTTALIELPKFLFFSQPDEG